MGSPYHESRSIQSKVRVVWDTSTSKAIGGNHEEIANFSRANHVRIASGIDRRDDRGDLSKVGGVAANDLSMEETVWSDGTDGHTQTQAAWGGEFQTQEVGR